MAFHRATASLRRVEALVRPVLQRERREEILAHDAVFELGGLTEHVDQRLTVFDDEWRFRRCLPATNGQHSIQGFTCSCAFLPCHAFRGATKPGAR